MRPRSPTARVHVAAAGNAIRETVPDGSQVQRRWPKARTPWRAGCGGDVREATASPSPPRLLLLPPLGMSVRPSREAFRGNWDTKATRRAATWLATCNGLNTKDI